MNSLAVGTYVILVLASFYSNKYVLTELGFQFPMVFQGWQTLVGFIVLCALAYFPNKASPTLTVMAIDRSGLVSLLPNFFLFTVMLIAGSKALSHIPIVAVITVANVIPAAIYLLDNVSLKKSSVIQVVSSVVVIGTAIPILITSPDDLPIDKVTSLMDSPKFWLVAHVFCTMAVTLHGRIADARFGAADRLFYSYVFSLVVLAPASLYLEEAFEALHFQPNRQLDFVIGSVFSAVVGVALNLYGIRLKEDDHFGKVHHSALSFAALLSPAIFATDLPGWAWPLAAINFAALIFVPSHLKKDDNQLTSTTSAPEGNISRIV